MIEDNAHYLNAMMKHPASLKAVAAPEPLAPFGGMPGVCPAELCFKIPKHHLTMQQF